MKLNEAQIINPTRPIQFRAAAYLAAQSHKRTASVLSVISSDNPGRAASLLVDINNLTGTDYSTSVRSSLGRSARRLISESIERMPTLDAAKFRTDVLDLSENESLGLSHAAWLNMDEKTGSDREYLEHIYAMPFSEMRGVVSAANDHGGLFSSPVMESGCRAFSDFYSWAAGTFLPANYGYQSVYDRIGVENSEASIPKTKHLDGKKGQFHQCFHTATAARGFFSQAGYPAEVFCMTVPGYGSHNVAVVYEEHNGTFTPFIADASPFRGGYSLNSVTDWRPFSWKGIREVNDFKYPLLRQASLWSKSAGGIPWACIPFENGMQLILNAEIVDALKYPMRAFERGTAEYYGRGETVRNFGFSANVIMPDKSECNDIYFLIRNNGRKSPISKKGFEKYELESFAKNVGPERLLDLMIEAAQTPAMRFLELLGRSGLAKK